jgi:YVTN family beta-propeller protein
MKRYIYFVLASLLMKLIVCPGSTYAQTVSAVCVDNEASNSQPAGIAHDNNGYTWVAFYGANYVAKESPNTNIGVGQPCVVYARVSVGTNPNFVAFDGTYIWVTSYGSNSITKIDPIQNTVVGTYLVGAGPRGVAFDGTDIWVANYNGNTVTKLDASNGQTLGTFSVGSAPWNVAVNTTDHTIWVANRNSNNVMKLNQSGSVLLTVATDAFPQFLAFDGTNMWVSCYSSQTIEEISPSGAILKRQSISNGQPLGLTWDNVRGLLWGATHGDYVYSFNPNTNAITYHFTGSGQNYGILFVPTSINLGSNTLWITDLSQGIVRVLGLS